MSLKKSLFKSAGIPVSQFFSMLPSRSFSIPLNQSECIFPRNSRVQMILCAVLQIFFVLPCTLKFLYSVEPVRMHFSAKQQCTNDTVCNAACSIARSGILLSQQT